MTRRPGAGRRRGAMFAAVLCLVAASACTSGPPRPPNTGTGASVPGANLADWSEIPLAPLGTELAALYSGLHEILYFQGAVRTGNSPDLGEGVAADCYRSNGPVPRVLNHNGEDYVLCFSHDRLARVEAVLRLPADEARALAQRACDAWLPASLATTRSEDSCGGRRGDAAFRLRRYALDAQIGSAVSIIVYTTGGPE